MGLDVSHDAFSGAYSAFNRFRKVLCEATGGHWCDEISGPEHWFVGEGYTRTSHPGLFAFFSSNDCEGSFDPDIALAIANEMEALLPKLDSIPQEIGGDIARAGGYRKVAERYIAGCRLAHANDEPLEYM